MKITVSEEPAFQPVVVTLTLESEEEAAAFCHLANYPDTIPDKICDGLSTHIKQPLKNLLTRIYYDGANKLEKYRTKLYNAQRSASGNA